MPTRDRMTGDVANKLTAIVHLRGQLVPGLVEVRDWPAFRRWLGSAEFKNLADRIDHITISSHAE